MNWAIFRRTALDTLPVLLATSLGTVAFVTLFSWAMSNMGTEVLQFVAKVPFLKRMLEMSLGIRTGGEVSMNVVFAVSLTHLVTLALAWSLMISTATRVTVGEVERGTADLLLSLPVSRTKVFISTSAVWVMAAVVIAACPMAGFALGRSLFVAKEAIQLTRFLPAIINLFSVHVFVGGLTALISVFMTRRAHAIGVAMGVVIVSAMLNFVEPFLAAIQRIRFVNLLNYFRPVDVVRFETWPLSNIAALLASALVCWLAALLWFVRKDIPAT